VLVDNMEQVLEAALRRKPKGLPASTSTSGTTKIVKDASNDPKPAPTRVPLPDYPPADQPPVIVRAP
jgi:hypothetical protein